jgi:hypothetical protein
MKITINSFNKAIDSYFHIPTSKERWKGKDIARVVSWVFGGAVIGGVAGLLGQGVASIRDRYGKVTKGPLPECPISKLPDEVLAKILEGADFTTLGNALLTSKAFNKAATKVITERASDVSLIAFGAAEWKEYMDADIGVEPPLPADIWDILAEACPFSTDGKTVAKTHLLMLIPETINGQPFNFNTLGKLFKAKFPDAGSDSGYGYIMGQIQNTAVNYGKSSWVLMTRDVIEGSRVKTFAEQQALVAEKGDNKYEVPAVLDAATCIFLEYARSMGQTGNWPSTFTRCQENINDKKLVIGGFTNVGLGVLYFTDTPVDIIGVVAMRKLS